MAPDPASELQSLPPRRRRWLLVLAGSAVAVAFLGWWGWNRWLPSHRPALEAGERYGVDVSSHQGEIDWPLVAADYMGFAYIKATEGGDFVDERFEQNWAGAGDAGLDRGGYHFFTLCRPGEEQAERFLASLGSRVGELAPAVDLELAGNCSARPDRAEVARELDRFLADVESATGEKVVLYVGDDFEGEYHLRDELERPVWHRRILIRPDVPGWWIWQVHGYADVDGIDGPADLNVMRDREPTS